MSFILELMKKTIITLILASLASTPFSAKAGQRCGEASFYGHRDGFAWKTTASGQPMNPGAMTTAHQWLPFGTVLRVTNRYNGRSVVVRVNDRGPFSGGRILDLSHGAFQRIASTSQGVTSVCYTEL